MSLESPPKAGHLTLPVQNGDSKVNGVNMVNSVRKSGSGKSPAKPGFFVSFLVDARGGKMHGKRHSGVDLIIPPSKVCMPTRITCRLIRKEKLVNPPVLKEGEALATRIAELGPVGEKFLGAVLIELPHFASQVNAERELIVLRSDNGVTWYEHQTQTPSDSLSNLFSSTEDDGDEGTEKRVVRIFTLDFPRYFVAVTRLRQDSKTIGASGGLVKSSISQAVVTFPEGAISKDIKVGLQVLSVAPATVVQLMGQPVPMSAVTTIEPRRRKFHGPVTLTIPVPKEMQESIKKQKKDENPAVHILYSITGGNSPSQWEDITGSAPLNSTNDSMSFSTIVSARYWLMDCRNIAIPVKAAGEVFQAAVKAPFLAKFFILAKRHSASEAQVRILCLTDDDINATLERQEHFAIIGSTKDIEVFEGKPYYVDVAGNFAPVAASGQELFITFHSFRINRLSFVARVVDTLHPPAAQLFVNKDLVVSGGKAMEAPLFTLNVTLPDFDAGLVSPDMEPEQWQAKFEAAKLSVAQERPPVGAVLKLTDIAEALQGDWVPLAAQLGISQREVVKIQTEYGSVPEQAILMLHLWVEKLGIRATGSELENALKRIGRDDVIDRCIYNRTNEILPAPDDQGSLNPIDSSFRNPDHVPDFEISQVSQTESQPGVEVEEGVPYQMEDVWDGTRWHKTKIAVQKPEETTAPEAANNLATNDLQEVEKKIEPLQSHELGLSSGADSESHSDVQHETKNVFSEPLTVEFQPSLKAEPQCQVAMELDIGDQPSDSLADVLVASSEDTDIQPTVEVAVANEPDRAADYQAEPPVEIALARKPDEVAEYQSDRYSFKTEDSGILPTVEIALARNAGEVEEDKLNLPAAKTEDSFIQSTEAAGENVLAKESRPTGEPDVRIDTDTTVGDPKVTTEVEEFVETLDDGTVVTRKVVKTKEEQVVTKSLAMECSEGAFDSVEKVVTGTVADADGTSSPGTVVEETEETLEDGTVVRRTIVKTTEQLIETEHL